MIAIFKFIKKELPLVILFFIIGDTVSTYYALQFNAYESNQIISSLISAYGFMSLVTSKIIFIGLLAVIWNSKLIWNPVFLDQTIHTSKLKI